MERINKENIINKYKQEEKIHVANTDGDFIISIDTLEQM